MQEDASSSLNLSYQHHHPGGALLGICTLYCVSHLEPTTVYQPTSYTLSPFYKGGNSDIKKFAEAKFARNLKFARKQKMPESKTR